jgi:hypothetical protein
MTKFAVKSAVAVAPAKPKSVIKTRTKADAPDAQTYNGADGWTRKPKSELFLLAVTNMVSEDTFYETGKARDQRFVDLIHKVVAKDPEWVARFVPYMRDELNLRTASIVMAAEYVKAGGPNGRSVISSALQRAEEPSVLLGYWLQFHGKNLPQPVKRGVADAVQRLYNERSLIKYDSDNLSPRFGDVISLTHAKGQAPWQHDLFKYALDKRHNREDLDRNTESLATIRAYRKLMAVPVADRRAMVEKASETKDFSDFEGAGLTWENLSGWLQGPMDAKAWETVIPQMGYMALIRNLRNFDDAKVSAEAKAKVLAKLQDPDEVAKSRQLPLRFLSAYKNVAGVEWTAALEKALDLSLANVPSLTGKTLIMVDVSVSMNAAFSGASRNRSYNTKATYPVLWEAAALFGSALAVRAEKADLYHYSDGHGTIDFRSGGSILRTVDKFRNVPHGGTNTWGTLNSLYKAGVHDRVVILTDEQANPGYIPKLTVPMYIVNLAGYANASTSSEGKVYAFGGLTDKMFHALSLIEAGSDVDWPF